MKIRKRNLKSFLRNTILSLSTFSLYQVLNCASLSPHNMQEDSSQKQEREHKQGEENLKQETPYAQQTSPLHCDVYGLGHTCGQLQPSWLT